MGFQDRDYFRTAKPKTWESWELRPVTFWLVSLWVVIWFLGLLWDEGRANRIGPVTAALIFDSQRIEAGQVWRIFSGALVNSPGNLLSILCNVLVVWWAGTVLSQLYRPKELVCFLILLSVLPGLTALGMCLASNQNESLALATPVATGVLALFACHFPKEKVLLFFLIPIPIWAVLVMLIGKDLFLVFREIEWTFAMTNLIAVLVAFVFLRIQARSRVHFSGWYKTRPRTKERSKKIKPPKHLKIYPGDSSPASDADEAVLSGKSDSSGEEVLQPTSKKTNWEIQLDEVLEKVQKEGKGSLTDAELQILQNASEYYRKRRGN